MTQLELTETIVKLRQAISEGRGGQVLSVLDRFNGEFAYDPARAQLNIASCDGTVVAAVLRVTPGTTLAQTLAGSLPLAE